MLGPSKKNQLFPTLMFVIGLARVLGRLEALPLSS
jgi:hypothetical protein